MKTRVSLKYYVSYCSYMNVYISNSYKYYKKYKKTVQKLNKVQTKKRIDMQLLSQ